MSQLYATDFSEIPIALASNQALRDAMLALIAKESMPGKITEGGDRLEKFRAILQDVTRGTLGLQSAVFRVEAELPRDSSVHSQSNRVFADKWAERLVRTQFSRFYSQAVMEHLLARGDTECTVHHSSAEDPNSQCSRLLAGRNHDLKSLHQALVNSYAKGNFSQAPKIPDHPHCTHVVAPKV